MHFAILAQSESWYFRDLARAALSAGHSVVRCEFPRFTARIASGSEALSVAAFPAMPDGAGTIAAVTVHPADCDAVLVRTMPPGSLEQVVVRMDWLARWQAAGTAVLNPPKALECAVDKYLTTSRLAAAGLPVPETIVCESADLALAAFDDLGGDVVVKPLFGSEGRGILRVTDRDLAERAFRMLERLDAVLYLQRFVDHGGSDLRVLVLGGQILGGMRRFAVEGFRTNVAQRGRAEAATVSVREAELALAAAEVTGTVFAGVDLLADRTGRLSILEVNAVPGWRAFASVHQRDIAREFLEWCGQHVGRRASRFAGEAC